MLYELSCKYLSHLIMSHCMHFVCPIKSIETIQIMSVLFMATKIQNVNNYNNNIMPSLPFSVLVLFIFTVPTNIIVMGRKNYLQESRNPNQIRKIKVPRQLSSSMQQSLIPTYLPTSTPTTTELSFWPTSTPSTTPSNVPSYIQTDSPSLNKSEYPTKFPMKKIILDPSIEFSAPPTFWSSNAISDQPSEVIALSPSPQPSYIVSTPPSIVLSDNPSLSITEYSTEEPSLALSPRPTGVPSSLPSLIPSVRVSQLPSVKPSLSHSESPSIMLSDNPSLHSSSYPTKKSSESPSDVRSRLPSGAPSNFPTLFPTILPTSKSSNIPSLSPTLSFSLIPSLFPSDAPSLYPSSWPSSHPTIIPTIRPSAVPSIYPSLAPTLLPTRSPTVAYSPSPSFEPTMLPSRTPRWSPSFIPSNFPSQNPSKLPSLFPSQLPTTAPTIGASIKTTQDPSTQPTRAFHDFKVRVCLRLADTGYISSVDIGIFEDTTEEFLYNTLDSNVVSSTEVKVISQVVAFESGETGLDDCPAVFRKTKRLNNLRDIQEDYSSDLVIVLAVTLVVWNSEVPSDFVLEDSIRKVFNDVDTYTNELADADESFQHLKSSSTSALKGLTEDSNNSDSSQPDMFTIIGGALLGFGFVAIIIVVAFVRQRLLNRGDNSLDEVSSRACIRDIDSVELNSVFSTPSFSIASGRSYLASDDSMDDFVTIHLDKKYPNDYSEEDSYAEVLRKESSFGSVNSMVTRFTWPGLPTMNIRTHNS